MRIILTRLSGTSGLNLTVTFCPIGSSDLFMVTPVSQIMLTHLAPSVVSFFGKGANKRKISIMASVHVKLDFLAIDEFKNEARAQERMRYRASSINLGV